MKLPAALRILLYPLSRLYGAYVSLRAGLYAKGRLKQRRLRGTVVSVGNLTLGGTGKTPMVLWLAEHFLSEGRRVAILTRGYRGSGGTSDEVEVMKRRLGGRVRFGVGPDRYGNGRRIEEAQPVDIFLLDDGFQHLGLARDLDILMLDGSRKLGREWLLPAGELREAISACRRAKILVVTRKFERPEVEARDSQAFSLFYAQTRLAGFRKRGGDGSLAYLSELGAGPFFAFCGIGNPQAFVSDLARWHVPLAGQRSFRDHHRYSAGDVRALEKAADAAGAVGFVTTEKDEPNLGELRFQKPVWVSAIDLEFIDESGLLAAIGRELQLPRAVAS